ncbi:SbcC/MukB-like Walker B domain-containing protein [Streptomyces sp. AK02-04a]|uniref:SbcC/MukB-like Walker B domain-containing protein n=1 Tax=Streptomyces sp. AK02-04a TaxID=3028649 RepID=UPI0029A58314|nr:SbcC/MukB-like Walker B domain-containing protein [Streptomyces sp. AK02-04a]
MLDYTVRHRFTVRLDRANGTGWQPLSKKLHGALPGGEKAIALYLPLFAAVAAHYEAVPLAPRGLIIRRPWVRVPPASPVQVTDLRKRSFLGVGAVNFA